MKVFVVGGSGYTGGELLRILANHPKVSGLETSSRSYKGEKVSSVHRNLSGVYEEKFKEFSLGKIDADMVFLALPHGESMKHVPGILEKGIKVVDLSADYRLPLDVYEDFYVKHESSGLLEKAVYGLPELYRQEVKKAKLIANPGCYPTSVILGLAPLGKFAEKIELDKIVVDSLSGTSGAGAKPSEFLHHSEVHDNLKPYNVVGHRHIPEMEVYVGESFGEEVKISFTPMLAPFTRGIMTTIHVFLKGKVMGVREAYAKYYEKEIFVRVVDTPNIKDVGYSNYCDIGVHEDHRTRSLLIFSAIDNLVKGAAGQAVQNMNLMQGYTEDEGLKELAGHP
ncbi:N-acetyl-gamma-glutamyl-phosphate reductase [Candidatus Altiarchaeota archaeon]